MMIRRNISKITQNHWHNGFLGTGHSAMAVLDGVPYKDSDPFILFMDDSLNLPGGEPVGGAHPHAGFETLTLVLEGNEKDWKTGSFELMTAGKGIIHTEEITSEQKLRILQVWLVLPPEKRYAQPFLQRMLLEDVPKIKNDTYEIRVYSGSSNGLTSPLKNHTPFTLVDFRLMSGAVVSQEIPSHYNGLVYVLKGSVKAGDKIIEAEQAGWLVFHSKSSKKPSITWSEAVDVALCFGWIDSKKIKIDHETSHQFFSKRRPNSTWSKINKEKVRHLTESGQMTQAGYESIETAKQNGSWTILDEVEELIIPNDLEKSFRKHKGSKEYFLSLSKSARKIMLSWIVLAKRPETRQKRIDEIAERAGQQQKPKQF